MAAGFDLHGKRLVIFVAFCLILVVLGAFIGVGIRSAIGCSEKKAAQKQTPTVPKSQKDVQTEAFKDHAKILDEMKADNIKSNLK